MPDNEFNLKAKHKDPEGGLSAKGRKAYNRATGSNLKPGVQNYSEASTADKKRWIAWALRFYSNPTGPMVDANGKPTRLALTASAWGQPVPRTIQAARAIAKLARKRKQQLEKQGAYE